MSNKVFRLLAICALGVALATSSIAATPATSPFPEPLLAEKPLASLIYDGSTSGRIQSPGDAQSYTLPVNAGETITVDVTTDAGLQAMISLFDPNGNVIGQSVAGAAGQEVVLFTAPAFTTGTYTITVEGANSTTGNFAATLTLNATLDSGAHGGPENSTLATAQDITSSTVALTNMADRAAVVGHFDGTDHYYSFSVQAGQVSSLALQLASGASVRLQLEDGNGNVLAVGVGGAQNVSLIIQDFVAAATGTYYARLTGSGRSDYSLVVTRGTDFELEPNDQSHPQSVDLTHTVLAYIGNSGVAVPDNDWYTFNVNAGDNLVLITATPSDQGGEFHNKLFPQINLYDNNGNFVATNQGQPKNTPVYWTVLTAGTYFAQVTGVDGPTVRNGFGEYVLEIQGATGP